MFSYLSSRAESSLRTLSDAEMARETAKVKAKETMGLKAEDTVVFWFISGTLMS